MSAPGNTRWILGVDIQPDAVGWARLDPTARRFVDLGVIAVTGTKESSGVCIRLLAQKAIGCALVVLERVLGESAASTTMIRGGLLGIVAAADPRPKIVNIAVGRWHRDVLPYSDGAADRQRVARVAAAHILERHPAADKFRGIPKDLRSHGIDAAMIALSGGLRIGACEGGLRGARLAIEEVSSR